MKLLANSLFLGVQNFGEEIGAAFHRFDKLLKVEAAEGDEFTPEDVAKSRTAAGGMSFVRNMANMRGNGISIKERTNIISLRKQVGVLSLFLLIPPIYGPWPRILTYPQLSR